jgi:hypothetical protein
MCCLFGWHFAFCVDREGGAEESFWRGRGEEDEEERPFEDGLEGQRGERKAEETVQRIGAFTTKNFKLFARRI